MKKIKKIFCVSILITFILFSCSSDDEVTGYEEVTVKLGALISLSGGGPVQGESVRASLETAVEDINSYFTDEGSSNKVRLEIADIENNINTYIARLKEMINDSIKIIITTSTSAHLEIIKGVADTSDVILIDQGSTSPTLSVTDNIFRLVPDDVELAEVLADVFSSDGIEKLFIFYRRDLWGINLSTNTETYFEQKGGTVLQKIEYNARILGSDFDSKLEELDAAVGQAISQYGNDNVAVSFLCFEEGVELIEKASSYTHLSSVKWYGSDGFTQNTDLLLNETAAQFTGTVDFLSPIFGMLDNNALDEVKAAVEQKTGDPAYVLGLVAYDALWIAGLTLSENPNADIGTLKSALKAKADNYTGISGTIILNDYENRTGTPYDFWGVVYENGSYLWKKLLTHAQN